MQTKILMVCLGNICRSPLAQGILQNKLPSQFYWVDSAGTAAWHSGQQPDERSIAIAKKNGLDITEQRARQFKITDFFTFDYIYAMDKYNYENIVKMAPDVASIKKVKLILNEVSETKNEDIPDPYYGGSKGFEKVYAMLDEACEIVAKKITI